MTLLAIKGLTLDIFGTPILKGIDLSVAKGEIVGIIGESGSGKSMTALSVMQLLPDGAHVAGSITLDGADLLQKSEREMCDIRGKDVGTVFQEPMTALNPLKTIGDQVAETVLTHTQTSRADAAKIARETLDRVGLGEERFPLDRYPHELSGGQRQRVVIAMAI
ncbi:MAG: ATP-binding cassette domain-containing protein, partial [Devosia sp.]